MISVLAQRITNPLTPKLVPSGPDVAPGYLSLLVQRLITLTLIIAVIVFFFTFLAGGIQWIVSGGDKAKTEAARGKITNAVVGLILIFALWAILSLIETFFGLDIITLDIGNLIIK